MRVRRLSSDTSDAGFASAGAWGAFRSAVLLPFRLLELGVSHATVERDWAMAKAWLFRDMKRAKAGGE